MGSVIFKKPPVKKLSKEGFYGVDLHFHTQYSMDAVSRINSCLKKAAGKGFGFAVTDHNEIKGALEAYKLAKDNVIVIPGIEITCNNGVHMLGYFYTPGELAEFYTRVLAPKMNTPFFVNHSVEEIVSLGKSYGGIICAAHPYAIGGCGIQKILPSKEIDKKLKLIEVINGYNFRKSNMKAAYWAASSSKAMTAGSDGHATLELGKALTFTKGTDVETILDEVLKDRALVIGKEEGFLSKAIMAVSKESTFIRRSKQQKMTKELLRRQLGVEYTYFKNKLANGKMANFVRQHAEQQELMEELAEEAD